MAIFKKIFRSFNLMGNKIINVKTEIPEIPTPESLANLGYVDGLVHKTKLIENFQLTKANITITHNLDSINILALLRIYDNNTEITFSTILPHLVVDSNTIKIISSIEKIGELLIIKF